MLDQININILTILPKIQIDAILAKYKNASNILWAQEEPANMGAWTYFAMALRHLPIIGVSRNASAASAEGSSQLHKKRLKNLFDELFKYASVTVK